MDLDTIRNVYYALSDEIRLKILRLLHEFDELCVCQLLPVLKISQPNLSFHLRILRDAGLVKSKKKAKWVFYSLNRENEFLKRNIDFIKKIPLEEEINSIKCDIL